MQSILASLSIHESANTQSCPKEDMNIRIFEQNDLVRLPFGPFRLVVVVIIISAIMVAAENCDDQTDNLFRCKLCCAELRLNYLYLDNEGISKSCKCQGELPSEQDEEDYDEEDSDDDDDD